MTKNLNNEAAHPGDVWRMVIAGTEMSQSAVAERMGASVAGLSRILRKAGVPSPGFTIKFAEATGSDVTAMWQVVADYELAVALAAKPVPAKKVATKKAPAKAAPAKVPAKPRANRAKKVAAAK